jgi:hypothetical protein
VPSHNPDIILDISLPSLFHREPITKPCKIYLLNIYSMIPGLSVLTTTALCRRSQLPVLESSLWCSQINTMVLRLGKDPFSVVRAFCAALIYRVSHKAVFQELHKFIHFRKDFYL